MDIKSRQLNLFREVDGLIDDPALSELIYQWRHESKGADKDKLKNIILEIIKKNERQTFLSRFVLKDFDTWNDVLSPKEGSVSKAHKASFYEPHLLKVLYQAVTPLTALDAISKTIDKVKNELRLADYKLTASKRFRYDTTIRFLANTLRQNGVLSNDKKYKNKFWVLTKKGQQLAAKGVKSNSHK